MTQAQMIIEERQLGRYSFNDVVLEAERRELRVSGSRVSVEPKVFDVLLYLARHSDRVVSRDELLDRRVCERWYVIAMPEPRACRDRPVAH